MLRPTSLPRIARTARALLVALATTSIGIDALAADAAEIAARVCAQCHGAKGVGTDPLVPNLAGQHQEYLTRQLKAFASGRRRAEAMTEVVRSLDADDFPRLAAHFERLAPAPGRAGDTGLRALGRRIFEEGNPDAGVRACAGCHQPSGTGNARFPRLAGQHPAYLARQLADYRSGRRATDPEMTSIAKKLADDEMRALAEYAAGL